MALAANALTTVARMEAELSLTAGAQDAVLQAVINEASAAIEAYIGRSLFRDDALSEKVAGKGTPIVCLGRTPIRSITSLSEYDAVLTEDDDFEIHDANVGTLRRLFHNWTQYTRGSGGVSSEPMPGYERKKIEIVYDAGWVTPQQEIDNPPWVRDLPYDIEAACVITATSIYLQRARDRAVDGERILSAAVDYIGINTALGRGTGGILPDAVLATLDKYRRLD